MAKIRPILHVACLSAACGSETRSSVESLNSIHVSEGHLVEMVLADDIAYVANSGEGFTVARLDEDGTLTRLVDQPEELWRCTALALHRPSQTLYCAAEDADDFAFHAYDVSDPGAPTFRFSGPAMSLYVDDVAVIGDRLFVSRFHEGLSWLRIDPDGGVGPIENVDLGVPGANFRSLDEHDGDPLVLTTGARLVRIDGETLALRDEVHLQGPPLDLSVHGSTAAVALGSQGVSLVDLDTSPPTLRASVVPPAVSTAVDLDEETLVVSTLTGVFAYTITDDLASISEAAPIGFVPASGAALDIRMAHGGALVSNWTTIEHLGFHPHQPSLALDVPFGIPARRGEVTRFPVRNPGPSTLEVRVLGHATIDRFELEPGEAHDVELSSTALERAENPRGPTVLRVEVVAADGQRVGTEAQDVAVQFQPAPDDPDWRPFPGDPFPSVVLDDERGGMLELPLAGQRIRTVFHTKGCAAMWPELEDLAWLARHTDDTALPMFVAEASTAFGFYERYDLAGALTGFWGFTASSEVHEANAAKYGSDVFGAGFHPLGLPGPNSFPADYLVGPDGIIERFDRVYYGAHQP